jgi:hypothetical protein
MPNTSQTLVRMSEAREKSPYPGAAAATAFELMECGSGASIKGVQVGC